jgi:hypothetical protein
MMMTSPKRRGVLIALLLLAAAGASLPAGASKLAMRYALDRRVFRVCNLLVPPNYTNYNPYLFIALQHSPLLPPGWEFDNPLARPYVEDGPSTVDLYDLWRSPAHAPQAGSGPNYWADRGMGPGAPLNKSWPQYWEVIFTAYNAQRLRDYDLIHIAADAIDLSPPLRRALLEAVEEGATLWIDSGGGFTTNVVNLEPPRVEAAGARVPFQFVSVPATAGSFFRRAEEASHDLFLSPYSFAAGEIYWLGDWPEPGAACDGSYIDYGAASGPVDQALVTVLATEDYSSHTATPTIAACHYGAGRIVVSACGIGDDVEEWFLAGAASPAAHQAPDVKFVCNLLAWGTSWEAPRQAANNIGYTHASVLPPLDIAWQYPSPDDDPTTLLIGPVVAAPVVSHGRVYAVSLIGEGGQPARLLCFDAHPPRDLDGDGLADDGVRDYGNGLPYDLIWSVELRNLPGFPADATPRWAGPVATNLPDGTFAVLCAAVSQGGAGRDGYVAAVNGFTGDHLWTFVATPFDAPPLGNGNAEVRDISTPIVHRGWVYFLCSEFDPDLVAGPGWEADGAYGRAWCIDVQTGGGARPAPPGYDRSGVWCYPDPDLDDDNKVEDTDTERPGLLPPFAEPRWVAGIDPATGGRPRQLPPDPGPIPAVTTHTRNAEDDYTEAVVTVGTPVSMRYDPPPADRIKIGRSDLAQPFDPIGSSNTRWGGRDIALVPTPGRRVGGAMQYFLNATYYRVWCLQNVTTVERLARVDSETAPDTYEIYVTGPASAYPENPGSSPVIVVYPHAARYLLSAIPSPAAPNRILNPLQLASGVQLHVDYNGQGQHELRWLRGPSPWQTAYSAQERRVTAAAVRNRILFATTTLPDGSGVPAYATGRIVSQDLRINERQWQLDPRSAIPVGLGVAVPQGRTEAAPAASHHTVIAAMAVTPQNPTPGSAHTAAVVGVRTEPLLSLALSSNPALGVARGVANPGDPNPDHRQPVTVRVLTLAAGSWTTAVVDPWQYEVDYEQATLTFHWETAWNITVNNGTGAGHIYGRPLLVTWLDDNGTPDDPTDDHWHDNQLVVVPPLERFVYLAGFVKLRYYPVVASRVKVKTADGVPVLGWQPGEPTFAFAGLGDCLPHGWLDLRSAYVDRNGNGMFDPGEALPPGITLKFSYDGFSNDWGPISIPSAAYNLPEEEHQAPVGFGPSASAVAMAGSAAHLGTEGYDSNGDGAFDTPPGANSPSETLLSLLWDPAEGLVRGWLAEPAQLGRYQSPGRQEIPAATGLPALASNGLYLGCRIMNDVNLGREVGFVSHLATRRTLIVDASRVIECSGQEVVWDLTGTQAWEYGQALADRPVSVALNHPAKVMALEDGNLLVVDTGNNRVVEVDRAGNVVWPLDEDGYNYYSSPRNASLRLCRPSDAQRFYALEDANGYGTQELVTNTIIADAGHDRVVRVRSWWEWSAARSRWEPRHRLEVITPEYLRDPANPTRLVKAHYTHVAVLTHPLTGAVIGYLCAAANLNYLVLRGYVGEGTELVTNPPATAPLPGGGGTWALWAWLYDSNVNDRTAENNPLLFAGLRHLSVQRYGETVYVDIACAQYQGRLSRWQAGQKWYSVFDDPAHNLRGVDPGAGVFEFRVSYRPASLGLVASERGPDIPIWMFTERPYCVDATQPNPDLNARVDCYRYDYDAGAGTVVARPWFRIPLPSGAYWYKRFLPTSVQRLSTGRHLIANNSGLVERLTKAAISQTGVVCSSEVFEVETQDQNNADPLDDVHLVDPRRLIPDPYGPDWPDPLIAPVYAERVMR